MEKKMSKMSLILILVIVVLVFGPLLTIWSLNTLFPILAIPYSIETWLAAVVIAGIVRGDGISFKGK
jgi:hypothetical protein